MICVIIGHTALNSYPGLAVRAVIYSFHMPLFFVLSGYLWNENSVMKKGWIKHKAQKLLIPYLSYTVLIQAFNIVLDPTTWNKTNLLKIFLSTIFQIRLSDYSGVMWFATWMFVTQILMGFIDRYFTKNVWKYGVISLLFILGCILMNLYVTLPWHLDAAFFALLFMKIGYAIKNKLTGFLDVKHIIMFISIFVICGGLNIYYIGDCPDIYNCRIGSCLLYLAASISGVMCVIYLMKKIKNRYICNILELIGRYSLAFYGLHTICGRITSGALNAIGLTSGNIFFELLRICAILFVDVLIILPFAKFTEKKCPLLFGYSNLKKENYG